MPFISISTEMLLFIAELAKRYRTTPKQVSRFAIMVLQHLTYMRELGLLAEGDLSDAVSLSWDEGPWEEGKYVGALDVLILQSQYDWVQLVGRQNLRSNGSIIRQAFYVLRMVAGMHQPGSLSLPASSGLWLVPLSRMQIPTGIVGQA
jgi:hypothetical protein